MKIIGGLNSDTTLADITSVVAGTGLSGGGTTGAVTLNVDNSIPEITTLGGLASFGSAGATTNIVAGDLTMFNPVNDGNPTISLGSSAADRFEIQANYNSGAQTLDSVELKTYTTSGTAHDGHIKFIVDEVTVGNFRDDGLFLNIGYGLTIGSGNAIISDSGGTTTLNNIDALDATTGTTISNAMESLGNLISATSLATVGTITSGTWRGTAIELESGGTGLVGATDGKIVIADGSGAPVLLDVGSSTAIETLGTIGTGVWNATAIGTDRQKHLMHYQVQGYSAGSTNYVTSKNIATANAPFRHDVDIGSDGLDSKAVTIWMRTGGHVMPNACTLKRFTGWTAAQGSASQTVALFKVTLSDGSDTDPSAVLLQEITYTASGNQTADLFNETAASDGQSLDLAVGDIVFSAIKGAGNPTYFNGTFEVEF